jgi:hypothetical protein
MVRKGSPVRVRKRAWSGTALRRGFCVLGPDGASGDRCRGASGGARRPRSRPEPPPISSSGGRSCESRRMFPRSRGVGRFPARSGDLGGCRMAWDYRRSVDLFVVDDSAQRMPTRSGMGALVAVGGVHIPSAQVRSLERGLDDLCAEAGFPKNEEFSGPPTRSSGCTWG